MHGQTFHIISSHCRTRRTYAEHPLSHSCMACGISLRIDMWIALYLKSDIFRYPSLKSYDFRIANFTNEATDLLALPRLEDIAEVMDISHINRLDTTKKRVECAFDITEIVLDCID